MESANGRCHSTNCKTTSKQPSSFYTDEQREKLRCGLRILARMIARTHLRQASQSKIAPRPPADGEDGD